MSHGPWIVTLAEKVIEALEARHGKNGVPMALEGYTYAGILAEAAKKQGIDLSDRARRLYAMEAVKDEAKKLLRRKPRVRTETGKGVSPTKRWIEHSLPPGDRD